MTVTHVQPVHPGLAVDPLILQLTTWSHSCPPAPAVDPLNLQLTPWSCRSASASITSLLSQVQWPGRDNIPIMQTVLLFRCRMKQHTPDMVMPRPAHHKLHVHAPVG